MDAEISSEHFVSDWEEEDDDYVINDRYTTFSKLSQQEINIIREHVRSKSSNAPSDLLSEVRRILSAVQSVTGKVDLFAEIVIRLGLLELYNDRLAWLTTSNRKDLFEKDDNGCNAAHRACLRTIPADDNILGPREHFMKGATAAILFLETMSKNNPQILNETTGVELKGRTCLHLAADRGLPLVVHWLLQQKALVVDKKDDGSKTAWEIALARNDAFSVSCFAAHCVTVEAQTPWFRRLEYQRSRDILSLRKYTQFPEEDGCYAVDMYTVSANKALHLLMGRLMGRLTFRQIFLGLNDAGLFADFVQEHFQERDAMTMKVPRQPSVKFEHLSCRSGSIAIVMPYFYSGTWRSIVNRDDRYHKMVHSKLCPDGDSAAQGLHLPLTLDEYCHPALEAETLEYRNSDQVIVWCALEKDQREQLRKEHALPTGHASEVIGPTTRLLMVHEVWMYRTPSMKYVIAFPEIALQEPSLRRALTQKCYDQNNFMPSPWEHLIITARWLLAFILLLETPAGLDNPVLGIYENQISRISSDVDRYFGQTIKEQEKAANDEKQYFHDIADIREELSMIQSVVTRQDSVWTRFSIKVLSEISEQASAPGEESDNDWELGDNGESAKKAWTEYKELKGKLTENDRDPVEEQQTLKMFIEEASFRIQRLKDRIAKADQDAERVENLIPQYLELKRSYTAMKEAHYTALLGAIIFGFSVVTIIFTPMSFILALLAVPNDSFLVNSLLPKEKGPFIRKWTGVTEGTSLGVTIALTILAWWFFRNAAEYGGGENESMWKRVWKKKAAGNEKDGTAGKGQDKSADGKKAKASQGEKGVAGSQKDGTTGKGKDKSAEGKKVEVSKEENQAAENKKEGIAGTSKDAVSCRDDTSELEKKRTGAESKTKEEAENGKDAAAHRGDADVQSDNIRGTARGPAAKTDKAGSEGQKPNALASGEDGAGDKKSTGKRPRKRDFFGLSNRSRKVPDVEQGQT